MGIVMKHCLNSSIVLGLMFISSSAPASAQLFAAKDNPVVYGHHHLNVTSIAEHKKFFVNALGGTSVAFGAFEVVRFPGVLVFLRMQAPTGGTKGSTVDHIGFSVPDLR